MCIKTRIGLLECLKFENYEKKLSRVRCADHRKIGESSLILTTGKIIPVHQTTD